MRHGSQCHFQRRAQLLFAVLAKTAETMERSFFMGNTIDTIRSKRSIRSFVGDPLPDPVVDELLTLGTMASTGSNLQPWGFVVIRDQAEIDALSEDVKATGKPGAIPPFLHL